MEDARASGGLRLRSYFQSSRFSRLARLKNSASQLSAVGGPQGGSQGSGTGDDLLSFSNAAAQGPVANRNSTSTTTVTTPCGPEAARKLTALQIILNNFSYIDAVGRPGDRGDGLIGITDLRAALDRAAVGSDLYGALYMLYNYQELFRALAGADGIIGTTDLIEMIRSPNCAVLLASPTPTRTPSGLDYVILPSPTATATAAPTKCCLCIYDGNAERTCSGLSARACSSSDAVCTLETDPVSRQPRCVSSMKKVCENWLTNARLDSDCSAKRIRPNTGLSTANNFSEFDGINCTDFKVAVEAHSNAMNGPPSRLFQS